MISRDNKYMTEASEELYELNSDDAIRARCRARKDYYKKENSDNTVLPLCTDTIQPSQPLPLFQVFPSPR